MAKAYTGRDGQLLLGSDILVKVTSWSFQADLEMLETTSLGESQRTFAPGVQSFSGTAALIYYTQDDSTNDASTLLRRLVTTSASGINSADTVTLTLRLVSGNSNSDVTLTAYIVSVSFAASVGEIVTAQINFQATGVLSAATI
jgi:hypothetical protein